MADAAYTAGILKLLNEGWLNLSPTAMFLDAAGTYTFDPDHTVLTDLARASNELGELTACPNYTAQAVTSSTLVADYTNDLVKATTAWVTWASLGPGPTIGAAVVFFDAGDDATSVPFLYLDTLFPRVTDGQDLTVQWSLDGMFNAFQTT